MIIEILSDLPIDVMPWVASSVLKKLYTKGDEVDVEVPDNPEWRAWFENGLKRGFFRKKVGRPPKGD